VDVLPMDVLLNEIRAKSTSFFNKDVQNYNLIQNAFPPGPKNEHFI
jgi:hypothetical protein